MRKYPTAEFTVNLEEKRADDSKWEFESGVGNTARPTCSFCSKGSLAFERRECANHAALNADVTF
jgi:hypothetical protein